MQTTLIIYLKPGRFFAKSQLSVPTDVVLSNAPVILFRGGIMYAIMHKFLIFVYNSVRYG